MRAKGRRELHGQVGKGECQTYSRTTNKWADIRVCEREKKRFGSQISIEKYGIKFESFIQINGVREKLI
jgi:hypothetical protein